MDWRKQFREEMEAGAEVVKALKHLFFPQQAYQDVSSRLIKMLGRLKHEARKAQPDMTEIQRMEWLARFTRQDVEDAMAMPDTRPLPKKGSIGAMVALAGTDKEAKDGNAAEKP